MNLGTLGTSAAAVMVPALYPVTKLVFEGTSVSAVYHICDEMIAAYPSVTILNRAVSSKSIGASTDAPGTNSLWGTKATIVADAPIMVAIECGQNDPLTAPQQTSLLDYIAYLRANIPTLKTVAVCEAFPRLDNPQHQTNLAAWNAWLWSQLGVTMDIIVPMGSHPLYHTTAAWSDTTNSGDGIHPIGACAAAMGTIYRVTLGPRMPAPNEVTTVSFVDLTNVPVSTDEFAYTIVRGLPVNTQANAVATGAGSISRGLEESYGSTKAMYNGQVVKSKVTSSASSGTQVDHTLTINGVSDTFSVSTAVPNPLTATYRTNGSATGGSANFDVATNITTYADVPNIILIRLTNSIGNVTATLGGDAMTLDAIVTNNVTRVAILRVTPTAASAGVNKTLNVKSGTSATAQWDHVTLSAPATYSAQAFKDSNTNDPQLTANLTVPTGGIAVGKITHSAASATPYAGCVEIADRAGQWVGTMAGSGQFGCNTGNFTSALGIAASYAPA